MKCAPRTFVTAVILLLGVTGRASATSIHPRKTNKTCTTDMDCLPPNSSCYQRSKCMCNDDYVAINQTRNNNFECVPIAKKEGDRCVHDLQCEIHMGKHAGCLNRNGPGSFGNCHCRPKHHMVRGLCHPTSHIGDSCKVNDDCYLPRDDIVAYCYESVCICPQGFHSTSDHKECDENKGLHGPCHDNDDCKRPNMRCGVGYCICEEGFEENWNQIACEARKPVTKLGQTCSSDDQCNMYLRESVCDTTSKTCTCSVGAQEVNNTCYRIARLGDKCLERLECVIPSDIGRVDCIGNICSCNPPYKRVQHDCSLESDMDRRNNTNSSSKHQGATALTVILLLALLACRTLKGGYSVGY